MSTTSRGICGSRPAGVARARRVFSASTNDDEYIREAAAISGCREHSLPRGVRFISQPCSDDFDDVQLIAVKAPARCTDDLHARIATICDALRVAETGMQMRAPNHCSGAPTVTGPWRSGPAADMIRVRVSNLPAGMT